MEIEHCLKMGYANLTRSSVAYIAYLKHVIVSWILIKLKNLKSHTIIRQILVITVTAKNAKLNPRQVSPIMMVGWSACSTVFFISMVFFCVSFSFS